MKRALALLTGLLLILALLPLRAAAEGPVAIFDAEGLRAIADDPGGSYCLAADIDLGGGTGRPSPFPARSTGEGTRSTT